MCIHAVGMNSFLSFGLLIVSSLSPYLKTKNNLVNIAMRCVCDYSSFVYYKAICAHVRMHVHTPCNSCTNLHIFMKCSMVTKSLFSILRFTVRNFLLLVIQTW